jgi:hypothetical protein
LTAVGEADLGANGIDRRVIFENGVCLALPAVPMQPTLSRPPFHRDSWIYEEKYDRWHIVGL